MSQPPTVLPPVVAQLVRRARRSGAVGLIRVATSLARQSTRMNAFATGFVSHAIDRLDRGSVTAAVYEYRGGQRGELFHWEHPWLERGLPPSPARILIGGAGSGREVRWLLERGYTVVAFDPVPASVARHNAAMPSSPSVVLDYETLARASYARRHDSHIAQALDASPVLDAAPYDAALLGWGSLSHVLEEHEHDALFETLAELVPTGPILASFFMRQSVAVDAAIARGRTYHLGAQLGRAVNRSATPHSPDSDSRSQVRFLPHCGFVYAFSRDRLDHLGTLCNRSVELEANNTYPHATFRKRAR